MKQIAMQNGHVADDDFIDEAEDRYECNEIIDYIEEIL